MHWDSEIESKCHSKVKNYSGLDPEKEQLFFKNGTYLWNHNHISELYLAV